MQPTRTRPTAVSVLALATVFVGGGGVGLGLAARLAPASDLALLVSFLMLPAALIVGFHIWLGLAVLLILPRLFRRFSRREPVCEADRTTPPGAWSFVPVSSVAGLLGGLACGLLSARAALPVIGIYWLVGTVYGLVVWRLIQGGYIPFPESD